MGCVMRRLVGCGEWRVQLLRGKMYVDNSFYDAIFFDKRA